MLEQVPIWLMDLQNKLHLHKEDVKKEGYATQNFSVELIRQDQEYFFSQLKKVYTQYTQYALEEEEGIFSYISCTEAFLCYVAAFFNCYLGTGLHLVSPVNALISRQSPQNGSKLEKSQEIALEENKTYVLTELEKVITEESLFYQVKELFRGIYNQDSRIFQNLQDEYPSCINVYYLFFCHVLEHFRMLKNAMDPSEDDSENDLERMEEKAVLQKEKLDDQKKLLSQSYIQYQKNVAWVLLEYKKEYVGTLFPEFPLPFFRYNFSTVEFLGNSLKTLEKLKSIVYDVNEKNALREQKLKTLCHGEVEKMMIDLENLQKDKEIGTISLEKIGDGTDLFSSHWTERENFLKMPCHVDMERSNFLLLLTSYQAEEELREEQREKDRRNEEKEKLFREQSHNWHHSSYPETIIRVANVLNKRGEEEDIPLVKTLLNAYNSNHLLRANLMLLKTEFQGSNQGFLQDFLKSIYYDPHGTQKDTVNILHIFNSSLEITAFRLFVREADTSINIQEIRSACFDHPYFAHLPDSFQETFFQSKELLISDKILPWFNEIAYPFTVTVEGDWVNFRFTYFKVAHMIFENILINLIINAINYGEKSEKGYIHCKFYEKEMNGQAYMCIYVENAVDRDSAFRPGNGEGLQHIVERVTRLNQKGQLTDNVLIKNDEDKFSIEIFLEKEKFQEIQEKKDKEEDV